ncbi:MAG: hypothetical protein H6R15_1389 [Proteobacteria bacterium]|nr:hypothetical protein [Pseudomonadota bacterium]
MSRINFDLQASHKMLMLLDEANVNTESIIDRIPGVFLIVNEHHEVLRANVDFMDLVALDAEDVFRMPLSTFFPNESWKIFAHNIKQVLNSENSDALLRFEMSMVVARCDEHAERQFHWTITRRNVKNDGEGRLVTVFGDDISAMRAAERRLAKVFNSIPLGIFTLNKDGTIGDSFSSCLESMLDCGKLAGAAIEEVLFKPALAHMTEESIDGIKAIRACLGKSELDYGKHSMRFPTEIFHNTKPDPDDGLWLRITYQPIVFNQIVEQLLIILEDRTAIVNAEQEMLVAAQDREKAIALEKQSLAVYESAIRDPLTRLYTRLYMKDAVAALLWKHDRNEIPDLSMVMFDIDHFKRVNDTYGHKSGDLILARVGGVIFDHSPDPVIPIRFGGEEFVVFMPADGGAALTFAEAVRKEIEMLQFDLGGGIVIQITTSCGVTAHRKREVLEDFMHRADSLLYMAKAGGRNQSVFEL